MTEKQTSPENIACWKAVEARDRKQDGRFVYAVRTSGVYCRPSCPSRLPLRKNVEFFETPQAAERAGFRACLRCRPTSPGRDEMVASLCAYIAEHASEKLPLSSLAEQAGQSPFHFQRVFKRVTGLSPKRYQDACRVQVFRENLRHGGGITEAIYAAGYGSSSRAYERTPHSLGMTPTQYRGGGAGQSIRYTTFESRFGPVLVAATENGVCAVRFGDGALNELRAEFPSAAMRLADDAALHGWAEALLRYLEGAERTIDIPLDLRATAFQLRVWEYLRTIPSGQTRSYAEVAEGIGRPTGARAVANACAANGVAVVIPCHRVVRGDGASGGYRWGEQRKKDLLAVERRGAGILAE